MIDHLIKSLKGILPDTCWDFIFKQFIKRSVKFTKPTYEAVRVSKDYILVRVPMEEKPDV